MQGGKEQRGAPPPPTLHGGALAGKGVLEAEAAAQSGAEKPQSTTALHVIEPTCYLLLSILCHLKESL